MSTYIDADELHKQGWGAAKCTNWEPTPFNSNFRLEAEVKPFITFPAADVQEVRHGRWIRTHNPIGQEITACSVCGKIKQQAYANYCGECESRMEADNGLV